MSTGDQSGYMRAKMAERGTSQGVQFMRDGFDNWAESTTPARAGQVEKMPAETQMQNTGGAMSVAKAKRLAKKMGIITYSDGAMCGGRSFLGVEIPDIVEKAIEYGEKILNFALLVEKKLPEIQEAIQDEIIDNEDDPSITAQDRKMAKAFLPLVASLKPYLATLKNIKAFPDQIKSALGSVGVGGNLRGGATAAERFKQAVDFLQKAYTKLKTYIDYLTTNGKFLLQLLKLRPLQPIGNEILDKIKPILGLVGLGRKSRKAKCECSDSEEYHGGRVVYHEGVEVPGRFNRGGTRSPNDRGYVRGGFGFDFGQLPGFGPQKQIGYSGDSGEPQQGLMMGGPGMQESVYMGEPGKQMGYSGVSMIGGPGMQEYSAPMRPSNEGRIEEIRQKMMRIKDSNMSSAKKEEALEVLEKEIRGLMSKGGRTIFHYNKGPSSRGGKTIYQSTMSSSKGPSRPVGGRKPSARGEIVKKVMKEKGLSLPQASKYVKENNLY